jgi:Predicted metal-dependent hydrolase
MEDYTICRSRRRSVALEITRDCRVVVRAPMHCSRAVIDGFVGRHADWITQNLERQRLRQLTAPPAPSPAEIAALKARAREVLPPKVRRYGAIMGLSPAGVRITAARTRFGSCSGKNALCFSCFLMNYPEEAIDLVVVHELCHIRVKNHGPAFYALLGSVLPDYRERKALLREPRLPPK